MQTHFRTGRTLILLSAVWFGSACSPGSSGQHEASDAEVPAEVTGSLPRVQSETNCTEPPAAPELCDWAAASDAIVIGKINEIRADFNRLVVDPPDGGGMVSEQQCTGEVEPVMVIGIDVEKTLYGSAQQNLSVHVGIPQTSTWQPMPHWENSQFVWGYKPSDQGLAVGQEIGLMLFRDSTLGIWSTLGQRLFEVSGPNLHFQEIEEECAQRLPVNLDGMALTAATQDLGACATTRSPSAEERRESITFMNASRPEQYAAGYCFVGAGTSSGCTVDAECGADETCTEGTCQQ